MFCIEFQTDSIRALGIIMAQPSLSALSILQPDMLPAGVRTVSLQFSTVSVIGQEDQKLRELPSVTVTSDGVVLDFFSFDFSTHHDAPIIVTLSYDPSRTKPPRTVLFMGFPPSPSPPPPLLHFRCICDIRVEEGPGSISRQMLVLHYQRCDTWGQAFCGGKLQAGLCPARCFDFDGFSASCCSSYLLLNTFLQAVRLSSASVVSWRLISPSLSVSTTPSFPTNNPPIASRFVGRYGAAGPKRVLPTSVDDLPDFASSFPEIFSASHGGKSSDQQVLDLMMMITQLTRFKPAVQTSVQSESGSSPSSAGPAVSHATPTEHYFGSSSHSKALEEVVLWIATSAARQVECQCIFAIIFVAHHECCFSAGAIAHV
jgi:hypothetical protein